MKKKTIPQSVCRWTGQLYGNAGSLKRGELEHCFIEANVCDGGCVKGPASGKWNVSFIKQSGDGAESGCPSEGTI